MKRIRGGRFRSYGVVWTWAGEKKYELKVFWKGRKRRL